MIDRGTWQNSVDAPRVNDISRFDENNNNNNRLIRLSRIWRTRALNTGGDDSAKKSRIPTSSKNDMENMFWYETPTCIYVQLTKPSFIFIIYETSLDVSDLKYGQK